MCANVYRAGLQDVLDRFPGIREKTGGLGVSAWCEYERLFRRMWHSDRARLWVDFYCRHLTFGDVGCSLSHIALWESAAREYLDVLIVLEDDTRPLPGAFATLFREIEGLEEGRIAWDLILCHSTLYDQRPEVPVPGSSRLVWSGHRKLTDFYVLSRRGVERLAGCGFRDSVMPVDDFLPAAFRCSSHPRPDVNASECVMKLRGSGKDGEEGLAAFAFPENLSTNLAKQVGSASRDTPCILGDSGAQVNSEDSGEESQTGSPAAVGVSSEQTASGRCPFHTEWRDGHSWGIVRGAPAVEALRLLEEAEAAWWPFFTGAAAEDKQRCRGTGGRKGPLLLWGNGFSDSRLREMFHVVLGAPGEQPFPSPHARDSLLKLAAHLKEVCRALMAAVAGSVEERACQQEGHPGVDDLYGPSVMDVFYYHNRSHADAEERATGLVENMSGHLDPGFLTITSPSLVPGLEVWGSGLEGGDSEAGWIPAEALAQRDELIFLAGSELQDATAGACLASRHRVVMSGEGPRLSCVFELRSR